MKKTIGILGGMGPAATAYFFELIIKNTKAEKDQEHIPVIIYSNPEVPPRTDAILKKGENPLPHLLEGARVLRQAGADFIVMPCVTAHYFLDEIVAREKVLFLSLLDETLLYALRKRPELKKAGLISSTGTLKSGLFHDAFAKEEIEVFGPEDKEQEQVRGGSGYCRLHRGASCPERERYRGSVHRAFTNSGRGLYCMGGV
jgi:aspartate racemase